MTSYFARIWELRHFWLSLVRMDLRTRYRRSVLGVGWSLLQPLVMASALCLIFSFILKITWQTYVPHLLTGLVCWNFITGCALQGCQSFFQGEAYIRQCPLPLGIYPLRTAIGAAFHLSMGLASVTIITSFLLGVPTVGSIFSLIPTLAIMFVFGWSMAVLAGLMNVRFQDTQHLAEVGFQLCFYLTPIIWRIEDFKDHPLAWLIQLNPFVSILNLVRQPLLHHTAPTLSQYMPALCITAVAAAGAAALLRRMQDKLIFYL